MIKLTYQHLNNGQFNAALMNLSQEKLPFQASYNISKLLRRYSKELKAAQAEHMKFIKEYAIVDDKGNLVPGDHGLPYTLKEETKDEYMEKIKDFMKVEVEIDCHPIKTSSLQGVDFKAVDLEILDDLIVDDVEV